MRKNWILAFTRNVELKRGRLPCAYLVIAIFSFLSGQVIGQGEVDRITSVVILDSVVVSASRQGFSVREFIELVQDDKTFYVAFRNFRAATCVLETSMELFSRKGEVVAHYSSEVNQHVEDGCVFQETVSSSSSANFFRRKGRDRFYTYTLFDRLFLMHDTVCDVKTNYADVSFDGRGKEGHVAELKKLIFLPGSRSNVPFIGKKTAIFSEEMIDKYDFFIRRELYQDSIECYIFEASLKPRFAGEKDNRTVIKKLTTFFSTSDFQVISRQLVLAQYGSLYQFDVRMDLKLHRHGDHYLPAVVSYSGFWNIPTKKRETATFVVRFSNASLSH